MKMTESPLRFFSFASKRKQSKSDSGSTKAALKSKSLDFVGPTSSDGTRSNVSQSNAKAFPGMNLPTPVTVTPLEVAKVYTP